MTDDVSCYSVISLYGRYKSPALELYTLIGSGLLEFLSVERKEKPTYFAMISLGTLLYVSSEWKKVLLSQRENFEKALRTLSSSNPIIVQICQELRLLFEEESVISVFDH